MDDRLRVLIVDDQPAVVQALAVLLDLNDIESVKAASAGDALRIAAEEPLGAVIQDMNFSHRETSGEEGIDLFHTLRRAQPELPILLMTAWAALETAVEMVREGAVDYIQKPWDDEKLVALILTVLESRRTDLESRRDAARLAASRRELAARHDLRGLVYASEAMHRLLSLALSVAESAAPVLITGPSGSGKELVAEIIQANSGRRDGPFIRVNVGAIPDSLLEAELFGAEAGAYTGARARRIGHFESADGGTLFLDEVDSLALAGQVKLLRLLQSGEFQRLGSSRSQRADVRIVSATNASLVEAMNEGRFREDLFYRLNVVELPVPALAARPEDILPLARHFLATFAPAGKSLELTAETEAALVRHPWTGNVRELENRIQRSTLVARDGCITVDDLGLAAAVGDLSSGGSGSGLTADTSGSELTADEETERIQVVQALTDEDGIIAHAADRLGVSRQALYRKMSRLGIEVERRPKSG